MTKLEVIKRLMNLRDDLLECNIETVDGLMDIVTTGIEELIQDIKDE